MSTFNQSPKLHPLHIQELVDLICELLEVNDQLCLMRTSRAICPLVEPWIWRVVEEQVIMELIVEQRVTDGEAADGIGYGRVSGVDFTRFDIYAPFVRHLRVHSRAARYFTGERRSACVSRAQRNALLPALTSITLLTTDLYPNSNGLFWLDLLLTPSVKHLCVKPFNKSGTAWVSHHIVNTLWEKVSENAPAIESLEFYPMDLAQADRRDASNDTLWLAKSIPDKTLSQLQNLKSNTKILDNGGVSFLGALPHLRYLTIYGLSDYPVTERLNMPNGSFPGLTELNLLRMDRSTLQAIMASTQLLTAVKFLNITISLRDRYNTVVSPEKWLIQKLPVLLAWARRLKSFTLDEFPSTPYGHYSYPSYISPVLLIKAMSKMPLEHLSLSSIRFDGNDYVHQMVDALPRLISLRLQDHVIQASSLCRLADLPHLKHLVLWDVVFEERVPVSHPKAGTMLERFETGVTLEAPGYPRDEVKIQKTAEKAARLITSLWPRLANADLSPEPSYRSDEYSVWNFSQELNVEMARIRLSRGINEL